MKGPFQFVVQKHKATSLHYDVRLEIGGVMSSWSVPKGPTLDCCVKRLGLKTEDHAVSYNTFEGVIPPGSYGAGPVMVWDTGTFFPEVEIEKGIRKVIEDKKAGEEMLMQGLIKGEIKFLVLGEKLKGSFAFVRTKNFGPKNSWLLIKHKDQFCQTPYDITQFDFSVLTKKSFKEIV